MVSRLEAGWPRARAATFAYTSTAFPMLTGTLVTIFGFIPIGLSRSMAGEYTFSLFAVVGMALLVSWFVAVLFAPVIGMKMLKENPGQQEPRPSRPARIFHRMLRLAMRRPRTTVTATLLLFAAAILALPLVPEQFFPSSDRPELLVDMTLRHGVSIRATDEVSKRMDALLKGDPDIAHWSSYVGRGAIRFYLPLDEKLPNDFFAQTVIVTRGNEARERVRKRLQHALDHDFPELLGRISSLELGPPVGWPVQYRIAGRDADLVQHYGRRLAAIMAANADLHYSDRKSVV